jgi:hypothetical protein
LELHEWLSSSSNRGARSETANEAVAVTAAIVDQFSPDGAHPVLEDRASANS